VWSPIDIATAALDEVAEVAAAERADAVVVGVAAIFISILNPIEGQVILLRNSIQLNDDAKLGLRNQSAQDPISRPERRKS
jgi:hypothetical protein